MFTKFKHFGSLGVIQQFKRSMSETVTVRVAQGQLKGMKAKTLKGTEFVSFKGIPYAKPPVGALRFRPPQPVESWSGVRDALVEGNVCPQRCLFNQDIRGNEDCLYLNVYTPKLPQKSENTNKPVMVWIHGGAFITGSGNSEFYGPDFIVNEDVILVTINYRFGIFGFLSMEEAGIRGNAGLKDQVVALRWIKQNIEQFGGDPYNITLFGESAGSVSTHYHLLSPMSKDLFQRGISLSCTSLNPFGFMDNNMSHRRAFTLGQALGCKTDRPDVLVDFFMQQPAEVLAKNLNKALEKEHNRRGEAFPFLPTTESPKTHDGDEAFLLDTPINLLEAGRFQRVPYIFGCNSNEGMLMTRNVINDPTLWKKMDEEFEKCIVMPLDLNIQRYTDQSRALAEVIKKFYYGNEPLSEKDVLNYAKHTSDTFFTSAVHRAMKLQATKSSFPTYMYEFSFDGTLGLFKQFINHNGMPGTTHGDILGYLFTHFLLDHDIDPDSMEMKTVKRLTKLFTNFAKTGNPTPEDDTELNVNWEPATEANKFAYLSIDKDLAMKTEREKERMDFWEQIYQHFGCKYSIQDIGKMYFDDNMSENIKHSVQNRI